MKLIIDTHVLIWSYFDPQKLTQRAQTYLTDPNNSFCISAASHWEIAIKIGTKKLSLRESFADFVQHAVFDNGIAISGIEPRHSEKLASLPHHHRDPFDRMLVSQALVEQLPIISIDQILDAYGVQRIW